MKALKSELKLRQRSYSFSLVLTLVLVPIKADPITKKQNYKRDMIRVSSAGRIYQSDFHISY